MHRLFFLLFFFPPLSWAIDAGKPPGLSFEDALTRADVIYLGRVEKVGNIPDTGPSGFNRRAQLTVLKVFKGRQGPHAEVYFLRHVDKPWLQVPNALQKIGAQVVVFASSGETPSTDLFRGSFAFPYDPDQLDQAPQKAPAACKLRALVAFAALEQMESVLDKAKCGKNTLREKH